MKVCCQVKYKDTSKGNVDIKHIYIMDCLVKSIVGKLTKIGFTVDYIQGKKYTLSNGNGITLEIEPKLTLGLNGFLDLAEL